jgi:hypothetical protein
VSTKAGIRRTAARHERERILALEDPMPQGEKFPIQYASGWEDALEAFRKLIENEELAQTRPRLGYEDWQAVRKRLADHVHFILEHTDRADHKAQFVIGALLNLEVRELILLKRNTHYDSMSVDFPLEPWQFGWFASSALGQDFATGKPAKARAILVRVEKNRAIAYLRERENFDSELYVVSDWGTACEGDWGTMERVQPEPGGEVTYKFTPERKSAAPAGAITVWDEQ